MLGRRKVTLQECALQIVFEVDEVSLFPPEITIISKKTTNKEFTIDGC